MFSLKYILFAYDVGNFNGQNFLIRDPFYTKWVAVGGLSGLGAPTDMERNITGLNSVTATVQVYTNGAIYSITSGSLNGSVLAVTTPVYSVYAANGADRRHAGLAYYRLIKALTNGTHRQSFRGVTWSTPRLRARHLGP